MFNVYIKDLKGVFYTRINNSLSYSPKNDPNVDEAIALVDSLGFWTTVGVVSVIISSLKSNINHKFSRLNTALLM